MAYVFKQHQIECDDDVVIDVYPETKPNSNRKSSFLATAAATAFFGQNEGIPFLGLLQATARRFSSNESHDGATVGRFTNPCVMLISDEQKAIGMAAMQLLGVGDASCN